MSEFSRTHIERSGYEREGFAALYDGQRPRPPAAVVDVLLHLVRRERARLVVDLGAGTGLSTRLWAERAEEVVGIEANPAMVAQARAATDATNVRYVEAFGSDTELAGGGADLVTCAQSFHWMEPQPVLAEAARLLRSGGAFAAYDYDTQAFVVHPEIDHAFVVHDSARSAARRRLGLPAGAATWPKERHVEQIRASGHFTLVRELVCHGWEEVDAARVVGLAESIGGPSAIFGDDAPEVDETLEELQATAERVLGDASAPMLVCYRVRAGLRP